LSQSLASVSCGALATRANARPSVLMHQPPNMRRGTQGPTTLASNSQQ
jgi:hypothetical protein